MKIEITEAEKIEELLHQLRKERATLEYITSNPDNQRSLWHSTIIGDVTITHEELVSIINTRIEANVRHLAQRYQIDFAKANVNSSAPIIPPPATSQEGAQ